MNVTDTGGRHSGGDCLNREQIDAYVGGNMSAEAAERAAAHAASCDACRRSVEARRAENRLAGEIRDAFDTQTAERSAGQSPGSDSAAGPPPNAIEGYEILGEIHRGGQGVVYKAIQKSTKRTCALKVLLEGPYASARQRRRFEREIDLAAGLRHPNIVTVYDSGVAGGRHYFAMEYIHGRPLDEYLSDKDLSIEDTLRLFQKICAAVNYAHQRGVIHRDLKPDNIRVDGESEPHVLDFGLARAAGPELHEGAPVTMTGQILATLPYASPEQTKGDPTLIDIRTDVYSLGVILYEMLTGKYPYPVVGEMAEVLKNIAEAEPRRPSTIRRQINDEVETIVLTSLAKERERRYQSAEALGRDVSNYLAGEAIDAKRDRGWYVLKKSLRRYRLAIATMASFMLVLGLSSVSLWSLLRAKDREYRRAELQTETARRERDRAIHAHRIIAQFLWCDALPKALYKIQQLDKAHGENADQVFEFFESIVVPEEFEPGWFLAESTLPTLGTSAAESFAMTAAVVDGRVSDTDTLRALMHMNEFGRILLQLSASLEVVEKPRTARKMLLRAHHLLRDAWKKQKALMPGDSPMVAISGSDWGRSLAQMRHFAEAERRLLEFHRAIESHPDAQDAFKAKSLRNVIYLYEAWDKPELAKKYRRTLATLNNVSETFQRIGPADPQ